MKSVLDITASSDKRDILVDTVKKQPNVVLCSQLVAEFDQFKIYENFC